MTLNHIKLGCAVTFMKYLASVISLILLQYYHRGGTTQGKIIPIKRHFANSTFGIISPLVGSGHHDKYSYEISKPKLIYI